MKKYKIYSAVFCLILVFSLLSACSKSDHPGSSDSTIKSSSSSNATSENLENQSDKTENFNIDNDQFYFEFDYNNTDSIIEKVQHSPILSFYNKVLEDILKNFPDYLNSSDIFIIDINQLPAMSLNDINVLVSYFKNYYSINIRNLKQEEINQKSNETILKIKNHDLHSKKCKLSLSISKKDKKVLNLSYSAEINLVQNIYKVNLKRKII